MQEGDRFYLFTAQTEAEHYPPGEVYGDWFIDTKKMEEKQSPSIFHIHLKDPSVLISKKHVNKYFNHSYHLVFNGKCRECGAAAAKGIIFRAATYRLGDN